MKKADLIVDLQYGSTGKGLIAGVLAKLEKYDMVINANMPNAGHTYIDEEGRVMMHKVLPNGLVSPNIKHVMLGPGSIFSIEQLEKEMAHTVWCGYSHYKLIIHENACVVTGADKEWEERFMPDIGSTKQGTSAVIVKKIKRNPIDDPTVKARLRNNGLYVCIATNAEWLKLIHKAKNILIEGAQGYSLGINAGFYPFCTSRDCTPAKFMADCGVPLPYLRKVIGTARLHPIRVGGNSGPCYPDQREISWEELGQKEELTTVTKRIRRVFTWSQQQMEEAIMACRPDEVFLNFCNYSPPSVNFVIENIRAASAKCGYVTDVRYTGWGPGHNDVRVCIQSPCGMTEEEKSHSGRA